ncbi:plasmid stabilization system [Gordonia neofelifaecis NRRL B-59395]|uniref:Plasmid stabilization system n=1 Tax=Gordonia neofelifaecis NRRL B-59395 TaxID=644548 RepID=F1YHW9_9ACTN|nr:plasmid stabilization system [Gordonia neofelifaecis NRRL B-59395]
MVQFIAEPLAENPYRLSKPLRFELEGTRSARRGDYRVLLRIDEPKHIIVILDINHRAHVYRT